MNFFFAASLRLLVFSSFVRKWAISFWTNPLSLGGLRWICFFATRIRINVSWSGSKTLIARMKPMFRIRLILMLIRIRESTSGNSRCGSGSKVKSNLKKKNYILIILVDFYASSSLELFLLPGFTFPEMDPDPAKRYRSNWIRNTGWNCIL